jgi:hypothetical protein
LPVPLPLPPAVLWLGGHLKEARPAGLRLKTEGWRAAASAAGTGRSAARSYLGGARKEGSGLEWAERDEGIRKERRACVRERASGRVCMCTHECVCDTRVPGVCLTRMCV